MRHRTVDLDGPVHYIDFGGEGTPLVMVHGLGGNAMNWMAVGPEFAKTHHAVALDLAGFGRTPLFRRSAALGANAELVHRFIEEVIGEPVVLMGNSMGDTSRSSRRPTTRGGCPPLSWSIPPSRGCTCAGRRRRCSA